MAEHCGYVQTRRGRRPRRPENNRRTNGYISLPPGGRWHCEAMTEGVAISKKFALALKRAINRLLRVLLHPTSSGAPSRREPFIRAATQSAPQCKMSLYRVFRDAVFGTPKTRFARLGEPHTDVVPYNKICDTYTATHKPVGAPQAQNPKTLFIRLEDPTRGRPPKKREAKRLPYNVKYFLKLANIFPTNIMRPLPFS